MMARVDISTAPGILGEEAGTPVGQSAILDFLTGTLTRDPVTGALRVGSIGFTPGWFAVGPPNGVNDGPAVDAAIVAAMATIVASNGAGGAVVFFEPGTYQWDGNLAPQIIDASAVGPSLDFPLVLLGVAGSTEILATGVGGPGSCSFSVRDTNLIPVVFAGLSMDGICEANVNILSTGAINPPPGSVEFRDCSLSAGVRGSNTSGIPILLTTRDCGGNALPMGDIHTSGDFSVSAFDTIWFHATAFAAVAAPGSLLARRGNFTAAGADLDAPQAAGGILPSTQHPGDYTIALGDVGTAVEMTAAAPSTLGVPTHHSQGFPLGALVECRQIGAGQVTVAGASDDPFTDGATGQATGVAVLPGLLLAAGNHPGGLHSFATSGDAGASWQTPTPDPLPGGFGAAVAATPGLILLGGRDGAATHSVAVSTDSGATWSSPAADPFAAGGGTAQSVAMTPGVLLAGGADGATATHTVAVSTDGGATFVTPAVDPFGAIGAPGLCSAVAAAPGILLAGGNSFGNVHTIARSIDAGVTWQNPAVDPFAGGQCQSVAIHGATLVAGGHDGANVNTVAVSTDLGVTWSVPVPGTQPFAGGQCNRVAAAAGLLVAAGADSTTTETVARSIDNGATWQVPGVDPFAGGTGFSIATDGATIVAGGFDGGTHTLTVSTDLGVTWVHPAADPFASNASADGAAVALGGGVMAAANVAFPPATLAASSDGGATWVTPQTVVLESANGHVHTATQFSVIRLCQRALNTWILSGDLA